MNYWTQLSIDYANQRNYLDDLFSYNKLFIFYQIQKGHRN